MVSLNTGSLNQGSGIILAPNSGGMLISTDGIAQTIAAAINNANSVFYPTFVSANGSSQSIYIAGSGFTYNPFTQTLSTANFAGNASSATTAATAATATNANNVLLTSVLSNSNYYLVFSPFGSTYNLLNIHANILFNPATQTLTVANLAGNASTSTALQTARSIYGNTFNGTADVTGIIASTFGGTENGFTAFTGPATSKKTFTLPNSSATILTTASVVTVPQGGTGLTSLAQGDILYSSALNTLSALAKNTSATRYLSNTGTSNNPAWAQINLTNGVTGALPVANGGTGQTTYTDGQLLIGNTTGNTLAKGNLIGSTGVSVTNGAGTISVSIGQDVATTANPIFNSLEVGNGLVGSPSYSFNNFNTSGLYAVASNDVRLALDGVDEVRFTADNTIFSNNVIPSGDGTYDSGTSGARWSTVYGVTGTFTTAEMDVLAKRNATTGVNAILARGSIDQEFWLNFRRGGGGTANYSGWMLSDFSNSHWFGYNDSGAFKLAYSTTSSDNPSVSTATTYLTMSSTNVSFTRAVSGASFNAFGSTQSTYKYLMSGQEFYQAANTSTDGVALLLGVNRTGNRQIWFADSAALTQNTTNSVLRIGVGGTGDPAIDAVATNGVTSKAMTIQATGGRTTFGGQVVVNTAIGFGGQTSWDANIQLQSPNVVTAQARCPGWNTYSGGIYKDYVEDRNPEIDLDIINKIRIINFWWKPNQGDNLPGMKPQKQFGYLAEDIAKYLPTAVLIDKNNIATSVDYGKVSSIHGGAIKALYKRFEKNKEHIANIEERVKKLEKFLIH
jgi:hypothetical protein